MKASDLLRKILRRKPKEHSSDSVDKAFIDSYEKAASTYVPSQQDRPPH